MSVVGAPEFLKLTLKAEKAFKKSTKLSDADFIEGLFCVNDMLDILADEIDKQKD